MKISDDVVRLHSLWIRGRWDDTPQERNYYTTFVSTIDKERWERLAKALKKEK